MRIAYVSDLLLPANGIDSVQTVTMASALARAGADVELVVPAVRGCRALTSAQIARLYGVREALPVTTLAKPRLGLRGVEKVGHAVRAARWPELARFDVVYTRNLPVVCAVAQLSTLPVVYETYRRWPTQSATKRWLFTRLRSQRRLIGLVLHSQLAANSYLELGYCPARVLVAHNGFDRSVLDAAPSHADARAQCGLPRDRFIITYAGRVDPEKGLMYLLDLAQALQDMEFVIAGSRGRGPIERRAERLPNVRVVPWQPLPETLPWLLAADALIIPPTRGPLERVGNTVLPIKTFLYLATGRPTIAPSTPDVCEVLEDRRNAVLLPPDDLDAAVTRIRALEHDPLERARIGSAAVLDAAKYTWEGRAARVMEFIERRRRAGDGE
ncbi:MAG: glycosyltransferase family 4 protein [Polyangiaceae bacterium]|nr:glycosyltransferase family 4 protein [Polyangiaceae bacterium]